jgi:hypothetical protein
MEPQNLRTILRPSLKASCPSNVGKHNQGNPRECSLAFDAVVVLVLSETGLVIDLTHFSSTSPPLWAEYDD